MTISDEHVKGGPANHGSHTDLDAPTPPGGPQRQDAPGGERQPLASVDPAPPGPEPVVRPSSTPEGPATIPSPDTPPGEPGPDPGEPGDSAAMQEENAATSLDQPSDDSGAR